MQVLLSRSLPHLGSQKFLICCALNKLNVNYKSISVKAKEDINIINSRIQINRRLNKPADLYHLNKEVVDKIKARNNNNCCDFIGYPYKNNKDKLDIQRDKPDSKKNKSFKIDKSFLKND